MNKENNLINFVCTIKNETFSSETFKIYSVDVDEKIYKNIKHNKRDSVSIVGNIPSLIPNLVYKIDAELDINSKFGYQYKVKKIKQDKPTGYEASFSFLKEITSETNAKTLLEVYPNIIDKIIKDNLNDLDFSKTKGIKEKTFQGIKQKVVSNFALIDIIEAYNGLIPMSVMKKLIDKYTNIKLIKSMLKTKPYKCLCGLSRIGFKNADKILLELDKESKKNTNCDYSFSEDLLTSKQRMKACIDFILEQNESNGNTIMSIQELRKESNKLTPQCINHFVDIIKDNSDTIYVDNELKCISSKKSYLTEVYIKNTIEKMNKVNTIWNCNVELYRKGIEGNATDEQLSTLSIMCNKNIVCLTAPAGSGKTYSMKCLLDMCDSLEKTYMLCTPTGKSSEVLSNQTGRDAGTIHRKLEYKPLGEDKNPWGFNEENKLDVDLVVIDEFSMVDIYLFKHLLDAIDINRTKLLLVFDPFQLPSVGCGNVAQDILDNGDIPIIRLTKIFRYNEGGLMQVATKIRNGERFLESDFNGVKIFGTNKDFIYVELQQQKIINHVLKIYNKMLNDGYNLDDITILASQNKGDYGVDNINKAVQNMLQKGKNNKFLYIGDNRFFKYDKVIQTTNNYKAKSIDGNEGEVVYNGNTGIIVDVSWDYLVVDFGGKLIRYNKSDLAQLQLGYCTSIHKSQGISVKQVICVFPKAHNFIMNSNIMYVAVTRARERVYFIGNIVTINRNIKEKANFERDTWLKLLKLTQTNY
ncbi:AAA family ATPase [Clostridium botulinum]|uniref:AAA family ATPase n=1 Tax=Clostridium botulinum TaxID=1491 RepID=UPI001C9A8357|nr:AAA family ATPase [Clostridium botulinum]MBY6838668.1 AAA family ATPase [Clostridium botulinum]